MQAVLLKAIGGVVGNGSPKEDGWVQFQLDREAAALAAKERLQAAAEAAAEKVPYGGVEVSDSDAHVDELVNVTGVAEPWKWGVPDLGLVSDGSVSIGGDSQVAMGGTHSTGVQEKPAKSLPS